MIPTAQIMLIVNYHTWKVYNEAVGNAGRKFGPDTRETKDVVREVDAILGDFVFELVNGSKLARSVRQLPVHYTVPYFRILNQSSFQ
jgi:hypothetical protein